MEQDGWEARMAARAAERRHVLEQAEQERQQREWEAKHAEWVAYAAALPPCLCPYDPCPIPPLLGDWMWQSHREYWQEWDVTGRCPDCQAPIPTSAQAREHDCPNAIALAAS